MIAPQNWRPPGWREIEEGVNPTPQECVDLHAVFKSNGYYTRGGTLSKKGAAAKDSEEAATVRHNVALLRDAWNTHGAVWRLGEAVTGVKSRVDPFFNPGCEGLDGLKLRLDGSGDQDDVNRPMNGLAVSDTMVKIELPSFEDGKLVKSFVELPEPLNWRGHGRNKLKRGQAPAAVNGPHSFTERWLKLCVAQGQSEIVQAFVPDNGDGWFQRWVPTASLVIRLGRIPCGAPPGIEKSSPRGASALGVWIPKAMLAAAPKQTRDCVLKGKSFRVPLLMRPKAGVQYAFVQPGGIDTIADFGLLDFEPESEAA